MSALNNLRKKGTPLTLGENQLLAEMVRSYPCLYDKTNREHKKRKSKALKRKKRNASIVADKPFKPSMPSRNMKCISPALYVQ